MVWLRGGVENLGFSGFLGRLVVWLVKGPFQEKKTLVAPFLSSTAGGRETGGTKKILDVKFIVSS